MFDKCIITHDGQSYLFNVLSFGISQNNLNNGMGINAGYPLRAVSYSIDINMTLVCNNAFQYFLDAFNKNRVSNFPVSSVKFDMELRSFKGNMSVYGCFLNSYDMPFSLVNSTNTVDCTIQADHYIYDMLRDEEFLRKERKEKLKEIFDGEL
jgi:hypothetical protein